jgi:hypothetical protein
MGLTRDMTASLLLSISGVRGALAHTCPLTATSRGSAFVPMFLMSAKWVHSGVSTSDAQASAVHPTITRKQNNFCPYTGLPQPLSSSKEHIPRNLRSRVGTLE